MKNITVLAVLVIITSTFAANNSLFCQEKDKERTYYFSIGPQFGVVRGQALEVVYPENTPAELLSELRWDMKPVFYLGAQIDIGRIDPMKGPGFFSSLSFKAGIPGDSGLMKDRDWMSVENTELTHFSSHTNETCEFYWLDIAAGVSLPVKSYFYIKPFLSGSWMRFSFEGRDGYGKYARVKSSNPYTYYPIDDDPYPYLFKGAVIRYTQDWFVLATGFIIGIKLPDNLSFDMSFQISPLTFCAATDEHLTTKTTYRDITSLGLFLEPAGRLTYTINHLELSLEYAYRYIGRTRGKTYQKYKDGDYAANGEGGAGLSLSNTRFLVKVRL